ncbi:MFS multidrug transporter [Penicillium longicatenatum]|nr:MFS multidrug transporter [Penicillium longicatenatum]
MASKEGFPALGNSLDAATPSKLSKFRLRHTDQSATHTHDLEHLKTDERHLVKFEGPNDPYNPLNWSFHKKAITTVLYGLIAMGSAWASSAYSQAISSIDKQYQTSEEVGTLGISLSLFGVGLGPLLWAPCSEVYGRKKSVLAPYAISVALSFATAVSKDIQSILITRFFTGFFCSAPITNVAGVLADIWTSQHRAIAVAIYALTLVLGTVIAPVVGGAMEVTNLDWRWTEYASFDLATSKVIHSKYVADYWNDYGTLAHLGHDFLGRKLSAGSVGLQEPSAPSTVRKLGASCPA